MPGLVISSGSSSKDSDATHSPGDSIAPEDYPAMSFPGYAERPLDEQLEPIAVVGMGCRLPGDVGSPAEFWDLIMSKRTGQTPKVPASRFNIDAHLHQNNDRPGSFGVPGGYFLNEDLRGFDPALFNITPIEAMWMDPQQRKILEVVYEALESGGISLEAIAGTRTGVFAASFTADWQQMSFKEASFRHSLAATGVDPGIISNRISHVFNLNGPSIMCNTACSSSVYALHNACNALRNGEVEGAIIGGTNLIITVDQHMNTAKLGVLSPTSTCHTFDERANGYGRAEAVGAVYLKRLSDAVRDGDPIRGVIRSSATNSNGKVPAVGITYPNRDGQADVIAHAYERGGDLDPRLTGYFETHGTGTAIGDPIEVEAVSIAMNKDRRPEDDPLWIGAVKTNIGHSEAASGLSALIKAILMVERGVIAPTRGVVKLNPKIKWDEWNVAVVNDPVPFPTHLPVKRVSINSFGYGGTNAHVIVEGAESLLKREQTYKYSDPHTDKKRRTGPRRSAHRKRPFLLPFSAHDRPTLQRNIAAHGKIAANYELVDLSYTLGNRRSVFASKGFAVVSHKALEEVFGDVAANFSFADKKTTPTLGFVFTGQGAQWARMGADLMANSPRFLRSIHVLDLALGELHDGPAWSIEDVLLEPAESSRVNEAEFSQPLCTAVQIAIVQLLEYWSIRPVVTVGHSSGEMAAAYAAGLISAREAITLAYYRGLVTRDVNTKGAMMAVGLGSTAVVRYLEGYEEQVIVACHNSPSGVTLSGDADALESVRTALVKDGVFARMVLTNGKAYHSHHMTPVSAKYEKLVRAARDYTPSDLATLSTAKMVSSVTNSVLPEMTKLDETYWSKNLRSPVLFNQAVQTILTADEFSNVDLLVEIGPHSAMKGPIQQIKAELKSSKIEYLPTLLRGTDCAVQLLKLAGELFLRSYPIDMERVTTAYVEETSQSGKLITAKGSIIVDLPPYQWNYTRPYWAESRASREQRVPKFPRHDVLGQLVIGASLTEPTWRNVLRTRDLPWLKDHNLGGETVFPAAGYFGMAMEAVTQLNDLSDSPVTIESYVLRDISIQKALVTPDTDEGIEVMLNLRPSVYSGSSITWWDFGVSSVDTDGTVKEHMVGSIAINARPRGNRPRAIPQSSQRASGKAWNEALRNVGFDYGPTFQDMDDIKFDGKNYWSSSSTNIKTQVDRALGESRYPLHPASIDSALQLCIAAIHAGRSNAMEYGAIPIQADEVTIWPPTEEQIKKVKASAYAWCDQRGIRNFETSAQITAHDGELVAEIRSLRCVSYEVAVPPKPTSALGEAPYGEVTWEVDFDSLQSESDVDGLTSSDLVSLALFKYPGWKVLHLGSRNVQNILQKNPRTAYTVAVLTDSERDALQASLAEYQSVKITRLEDAYSSHAESYDIIVAEQDARSTTDILPKVWHTLKPRGFAFIDQIDNIRQAGLGQFTSVLKGGSGTTVVRTAGSSTNGHANGVEKTKRSAQLVYRKSPANVVQEIQTALEALDWDVEVAPLDKPHEFGAKEHVIFLADFEGPLLRTATKHEFDSIRDIINSTSSLLWVTTGGLLEGKHPDFAMVSGLVRTVSSEQASLDFRTIDIDLDNVEIDQIVSSIIDISEKQAVGNEENPDRELCLSNKKRYVSRLVRNNDLNIRFAASDPEPRVFSRGDRIVGKVTSGKVIFQQELDAEDEVKPDYVEIQVQASGLTKEGVLVITGSDYPITFSHEIGGVVHKVGPGVAGFNPGDRVIGIHAGEFGSYQQVPASMLYKLGDEDGLTTAVSVLTAYASAIYGLESLASLQPNEKVLVLPNTGTSGVAAIKIAQVLGAVPYVAVRAAHEVDFLEKLGLETKQILRISDDASLPDQLKDLTDGSGADVIFSSGSTDVNIAREAWRSIKRFGRFLDGGRKDVLRRSALDGIPVQRGASYLPFDILDLYESRPKLLAKFLPTIIALLRDGSIVPPGLVRSVNVVDLNEAVAGFSDALGAIKTVIEYERSETPLMVVPSRPKLNFSPNSTYLLVGCLGGLGRSLTTWMMQSGARRFVFLSRSGADSSSAAKLIQDIEASGAITTVVRGDATSREDVVRTVQGVSSRYPIKGVVHAAMVLRDGLFQSMSFENWTTAVEPKIRGAANLHAVLSDEPLDFFLMTSSVSGILGNPAQSNYAAANTYLDSLARHRLAARKTAVSIVLPMVLEVGVVAENTELEGALKRKGMYGIDEENLLEAFEAGITSSISERPADHVVVGLDPVKLQKAVSDAAVTDSFWLDDARLSQTIHDMNSTIDDAAGSGSSSQSILATVKSAASPAEAVDAVTEHFVEKLARMLLLDKDAFEPGVKSIASYGIDSMIGAELRKWIYKEYKIDVPFTQLLGPMLTITKFAAQVCETQGVILS